MENEEIVKKRLLRTVFYIRVSSDEQAEKYGPEVQLKAMEAYVQSRPSELVPPTKSLIFRDDGESGAKGVKDRPELARLIQMIKDYPENDRPFDMVLVYRIDRMARKLAILLNVIETFEKNKVKFASTSEHIDTSSPFGRAMLNIMGAIAELERETILDRTSEGRKLAYKQGKISGTPYGYVKDKDDYLVPFPLEQKVVEQIFEDFTNRYMNHSQIAQKLEDEGVLSPAASANEYKRKKKKGTKKITNACFWRYEQVRSILADEVYLGVRYYGKSKDRIRIPRSEWQKSEHNHQAIVSQELFDRAKRRLEENRSRASLHHKRKDDRRYLLTGLIKCGSCTGIGQEKNSSWVGEPQKIRGSNPPRYSYYYRCSKKRHHKAEKPCSVIPIPAEEVERYVVEFLKRLIDNPELMFSYQKNLTHRKASLAKLEKRKKVLGKQIQQNSVKQDKLRVLYSNDDDYTIEKYNQEKEKLKTATTRMREEVIEIEQRIAGSEDSPQYVKTLLALKDHQDTLDFILADKDRTYSFIHDMISEIYIYARDKTELDKIAGPKKDGQLIPYMIDIKMRLPHEMLPDLMKAGFGLKSDEVCAR